MRLGQIIKKWRSMSELDLSSCSRQIGISTATLARLEKGHSPSGNTVKRILAWMMDDAK